MKRIIIPVTLLLATSLVVLLSFAPDSLSLAIIGMMALCVVWGFVFGMLPALRFLDAFRGAQARIKKMSEVQTDSIWLCLQQSDSLFHLNSLDGMFETYMAKAGRQEREEKIVSDIEEVFNEDSLALRCWWGVVHQIPGTLTALGLLGTFIGLIIGISTIGFSSVEAALSSVELLIGGIQTAFYTSIAGVILSILFNVSQRISWNAMLRELGLFLETFHTFIIPSESEQTRDRQTENMDRIVEQLNGIPTGRDYASGRTSIASFAIGLENEKRMMPEIQKGLADGEFIFMIQPRYDLNTKKITGGEVMLRWEHGSLGMVYPTAFMEVVERNGYVVRIDRYIWEEVCKTMRRWLDSGIRPVPLSVNISKTDILAMDVAQFISELVKKYDIAPRYLEFEIPENAYLEIGEAAGELEQNLRQAGFRVIIDGFDEEYLAMSVMEHTQADALKMDLRCMGTSSDQRESAVETMLAHAQKLNLPVIAKCIENAAQLSDLRRCGCAEGQGSYLKKPVSVGEFEQMTELVK